jgi:hypothetical protein
MLFKLKPETGRQVEAVEITKTVESSQLPRSTIQEHSGSIPTPHSKISLIQPLLISQQEENKDLASDSQAC